MVWEKTLGKEFTERSHVAIKATNLTLVDTVWLNNIFINCTFVYFLLYFS